MVCFHSASKMHPYHIVIVSILFAESCFAFYFYESRPHFMQQREDFTYPEYPQNEEYSSPHEKTIDIEAEQVPIVLNFLTRTSRIITKQKLVPAQRIEQDKDYGVAREEPQRISHVVVKPVIQEIREIITPYRKIVQEVQPMREEVLTIVMKSDKDTKSDKKSSSSKHHSPTNTKGGSDNSKKTHKSSANKTSSRGASGSKGSNESDKSSSVTNIPESPSNGNKRRSKDTKTKQHYF